MGEKHTRCPQEMKTNEEETFKVVTEGDKEQTLAWGRAPAPAVCVLSSVQLFATPWTLVYQIPLSMDFFRLDYWRGLTFPTPGDHPEPEIKPPSLVSPILAGGFITTIPSGKPFP